MKKIISLITVLLVLSAACFASVPDATENFYVADYADVISTETESYIEEINAVLENACGAQIVIVAATGTGGTNLEEYSEDIFNSWGIGSAEKNNGVLFVMALAEDDYWAMQGKGLENSLSSGKLGIILDDYVEEYFANDDFDMAARAFAEKTYEELCSIYGISDTDSEDDAGTISDPDYGYDDNESYDTFTGIMTIITIIIIIAIIIAKTSKPRRPVPPPSGVGGFGRGFLFGSLFRPRPPRTNFGGELHNNRHDSHPPFGSDRGRSSFGDDRHSSFSGSRSSFGGGSHSSFSGSSHSSFSGGASHHGGGGSSRGGGAGRGRR